MTTKEVQKAICQQITVTIIELLEAQEDEKEKKQERGEQLDPYQQVGVEVILYKDGHLTVLPSMRIQMSGKDFHPGSTEIAIKDVDDILQADPSFREKFRTLVIGDKALRVKEAAQVAQ